MQRVMDCLLGRVLSPEPQLQSSTSVVNKNSAGTYSNGKVFRPAPCDVPFHGCHLPIVQQCSHKHPIDLLLMMLQPANKPPHALGISTLEMPLLVLEPADYYERWKQMTTRKGGSECPRVLIWVPYLKHRWTLGQQWPQILGQICKAVAEFHKAISDVFLNQQQIARLCRCNSYPHRYHGKRQVLPGAMWRIARRPGMGVLELKPPPAPPSAPKSAPKLPLKPKPQAFGPQAARRMDAQPACPFLQLSDSSDSVSTYPRDDDTDSNSAISVHTSPNRLPPFLEQDEFGLSASSNDVSAEK